MGPDVERLDGRCAAHDGAGSELNGIVRPLHDELRGLALRRAGGGPSSEDGTYDPELLDIMCRSADAIQGMQELLREAYGYTTAADSLLPERIKAAIAV